MTASSPASSAQPPRRWRVAVIGGGISGLAAAHRFAEQRPEIEVRLFEASPRLGGVLLTEHRDDCLIEHSADMFTTQQPWARQLCERVGIADELIATDERYRRAMVVRGGKLHPVPLGFALMQPQQMWPVITSPLLGVRGKLRLLGERWVPPRRSTEDESLASFATRRFGREAYERLIQPLVGGIYTADPERLSMRATLARFVEMEQQHGSLIKAALRRPDRSSAAAAAERQASGARYAMFVTPRSGMSRLVAAVAQRLPSDSVHLSAPVARVTPLAHGRWQLDFHDAAGKPAEAVDAVIIAASARHTAAMLQSVPTTLAEELQQVPLAGAAIVIASFERRQIAQPLNSFGFVVPLVERRKILSASFASIKFPGRAPEDQVLVRIFVGGACQPELLQYDDDEIQRLALDDFRDLVHATGQPRFAFVRRWDGTMPQYHLGHVERVARIESLVEQLPGLMIAGNAYHGVGVPFCVHSGEQAAERVMAYLAARSLPA